MILRPSLSVYAFKQKNDVIKIIDACLYSDPLFSYGLFYTPGKCVFCTREKVFGKFDLFIWCFFLLENHMCSCRILRKSPRNFYCVLVRFVSAGKFICVPFLVLLEHLMLSCERITRMFSYYIQAS